LVKRTSGNYILVVRHDGDVTTYTFPTEERRMSMVREIRRKLRNELKGKKIEWVMCQWEDEKKEVRLH
jgi:hypothetical protein